MTASFFKAALRLALAALTLHGSASRADDIDIYTGLNGSSDRPNVLLVLDSSANWSANLSAPNCYYKDNGVTTASGPSASEQGKKVGIEKCALYNVIDALPVKSGADANSNALFNVGLMIFNESPAADSGGYPRKAFVPLTSNNKTALKTIIRNLDILADKGNNAAFAKTLYEAYLYYKGLAPYRGTAGSKWDASAVSGGRYVSPSANSCARNYVIFIANGGPGEVTNNQARDLLQAAGGDIGQITYPNSQVSNADQANWADETTRFMRGVDVSGKLDVQGIITHGVAVTGASSDGLYPNFIRSMANHGGGSYFEANNVDTLTTALTKIFNEIQAVNSVFASASLPVSVNTRGTYLNQVYMGMFRPDGNGNPRWRGNLKQYKFGLDALDNLFISDATGAPAISSSTGFIAPSAVSVWTSASSFWANQLLGTPATASDSPDGEVVEKGGAAQRIRSTYALTQNSRNVLTCVGCAADTVLGAATATQVVDGNSAITTAMLGAASSTERTQIIDWLRGTSNAGDEAGPTTSPATTIRPSVHGDVLHSRPAVVNYGSSAGVRVFYGGNDGALHAVNGNPGGGGAGDELWSFVPEEMFGGIRRLRNNAPSVRLSSTVDASAQPKDYFVDGPIGVYQKINSGGTSDQVMIYVGMRRGGRMLYALDVTEPATPKFKWKKNAGSSGMSLLGQTWSEPKPARVKGYANPVLIMGGGYDATTEDGSAPGSPAMGHVIYVLDALDGTLLKTFTMLAGVTGQGIARPVAASVTLVDFDNDGFIDRGYAVDLGGQVYRFDFESDAGNAAAQWTIHKVADLSGGTSTGRKFFFAPDAVVTRDFTALMVGSGDREKPLASATQDHFFQIFDRRLAKGAPALATPLVWADLAAAGATSNPTGAGCYVSLEQGEKVVNAATSIAGNAYFGTNRPGASASNVCSANLGLAKSYAMPLFCVAPTGAVLAGGGLPPSPVAGLVSIPVTVNGITTDRLVPFVIGAPNARNSGIEVTRVRPTLDVARQRRYWYQEGTR